MNQALILIVDPDEDARQILRAYFESHGYGVLDTPDAEDGLQLAEVRRPDVVIGNFPLDVPGPSSFSEAIRRKVKTDAPLIVFTARALEEEVEAAARVGDIVILKPASPTEVLAAVQQVLGEA